MRLTIAPSWEPVIRVFPVRTKWTPTDNLAFVGAYPMFLDMPRNTPVAISVTFSWHKEMAERIAGSWRDHFDDVRIGGPAYEDPGDEFVPGRFIKAGCTITSRGCPKNCGWCVVPEREGRIRELVIRPGWIVQDNNLLACSEKHIRAVFDMLRQQGRAIFFNGGLDKHFLRDWHRPLFDSIPLGELWFACDTSKDLPQLERAAQIMAGISQDKLRCYTMLAYDEDETPDDAARRCERVYKMGFLPFAQLFQPKVPRQYPEEWRKVARKWARPAAYRSTPKPEEHPLFETNQPTTPAAAGRRAS
jgi:hypothetical protein